MREKKKFGNLNFVILDRYIAVKLSVEFQILNLNIYICRDIGRVLMNNISLLDSWTNLHGFNTWT